MLVTSVDDVGEIVVQFDMHVGVCEARDTTLATADDFNLFFRRAHDLSDTAEDERSDRNVVVEEKLDLLIDVHGEYGDDVFINVKQQFAFDDILF